MRSITTAFLVLTSCLLMGQSSDTAFFPIFTPYADNPIINYGDELFGSPWNDPTILKEDNQYIMYNTGVEGGLNHPTDTISIYRWLSDDGYSWTLNPIDPVLEPVADTYYRGGIETPSVVFYNGEYHMYNTVYTELDAYQFKVSHATSPDGLVWQMDPNVLLEPTQDLNWMTQIVAEPGVMIKQDTLYLFFTAVGSAGSQSIGLVRSVDGSTLLDTTLTATLPTDVYPDDNYVGLSTPSPIMIGDTIYLFTDVAQFVFGDNWMQVALHQFKSYGDLNTWYHDSIPIHTRSEFPWTNGNYMAEIRSITPLMDGNTLRIWYAGHNISEIDTVTNDTIHHVHFIGDELHVDSGYWAIGTSEYLFDNLTSVPETTSNSQDISLQFFGNKGIATTKSQSRSTIKLYSIGGQLLMEHDFNRQLTFEIAYRGIVLIHIVNDDNILTQKYFAF